MLHVHHANTEHSITLTGWTYKSPIHSTIGLSPHRTVNVWMFSTYSNSMEHGIITLTGWTWMLFFPNRQVAVVVWYRLLTWSQASSVLVWDWPSYTYHTSHITYTHTHTHTHNTKLLSWENATHPIQHCQYKTYVQYKCTYLPVGFCRLKPRGLWNNKTNTNG